MHYHVYPDRPGYRIGHQCVTIIANAVQSIYSQPEEHGNFKLVAELQAGRTSLRTGPGWAASRHSALRPPAARSLPRCCEPHPPSPASLCYTFLLPAFSRTPSTPAPAPPGCSLAGGRGPRSSPRFLSTSHRRPRY